MSRSAFPACTAAALFYKFFAALSFLWYNESIRAGSGGKRVSVTEKFLWRPWALWRMGKSVYRIPAGYTVPLIQRLLHPERVNRLRMADVPFWPFCGAGGGEKDGGERPLSLSAVRSGFALPESAGRGKNSGDAQAGFFHRRKPGRWKDRKDGMIAMINIKALDSQNRRHRRQAAGL